MISTMLRRFAAPVRVLLAAGATLLVPSGVVADDERTHRGAGFGHASPLSGWHVDALQPPILEGRASAPLLDGDSSEDGEGGLDRTTRLARGRREISRPTTAVSGALSLEIHLRQCGHLSHRLDLPPPILS